MGGRGAYRPLGKEKEWGLAVRASLFLKVQGGKKRSERVRERGRTRVWDRVGWGAWVSRWELVLVGIEQAGCARKMLTATTTYLSTPLPYMPTYITEC